MQWYHADLVYHSWIHGTGYHADLVMSSCWSSQQPLNLHIPYHKNWLFKRTFFRKDQRLWHWLLWVSKDVVLVVVAKNQELWPHNQQLIFLYWEKGYVSFSIYTLKMILLYLLTISDILIITSLTWYQKAVDNFAVQCKTEEAAVVPPHGTWINR